MQLYTKAIVAMLGVLLPFLQQLGVALPDFLTVEWVSTILLALTPILVWFFPNIDRTGINISSLSKANIESLSKIRSPAIVGLLALVLAASLMGGCETIGAPKPESFNDRAGYAYGTHTAVLQTITTGLEAREISSAEATNAVQVADQARAIIDAARRVYAAGDAPGANRQLSLAIALLQELQANLRGDSP